MSAILPANPKSATARPTYNARMIQTVVWRVDAQAPDPAAIAAAAALLRGGGLVAFPTETVYGLGADALSAVAVRRIFEAKGRPATDPLIVHIHSWDQLAVVADSVPALAWKLARAFWPGPLTLVVPRAAAVPLEVTAGGPTVAVRMPRHPVALALLRAVDTPVAAPSANRFSRPSPTLAQHVLDDLAGRIEGVLDAGPVSIGLESTIVDVTQVPPVVVRPGGLPLEALRAAAPTLTARQVVAAEAERALAPGTFLKHYSPRAEVRLFDGPPGPAAAAMGACARQLAAAGGVVGVLAWAEDAAALADLPAEVTVVTLGAGAEAAGQSLFAALRALDARGVTVIVARLPAAEGLGAALRDRLYRAAEGRVTVV